MNSLPEEQAEQRHCHLCGVFWAELFTLTPEIVICGGCRHRLVDEGGRFHRRFGRGLGPPVGPPAERFSELFRAARMLLREPEAGEDMVVPTLWAAYELDRGSEQWAAIKERVVRGDLGPLRRVRVKDSLRKADGPRNIRAVAVVEGVSVLKLQPASAEMVNVGFSHDTIKPLSERWSEYPLFSSLSEPTVTYGSNMEAFGGVLIRVYPQKRPADPEEVASYYEEALAMEDIPYGKSREALMEYEHTGNCLYLLVAPGKRGLGPSSRGGFPTPRLVGNFYCGLLQDFGERLATRQAGDEMKAYNLVPACVAFLLRVSGVVGRKKIHELLNEHVLTETPRELPEQGYNSAEVVQLWRDVKKAQKQVMHVLAQV